MTDTVSTRSLWQTVRTNRYFRLIFLLVTTLIVALVASLPATFVVRIARLIRTGVPLMKKMVSGGAQDFPTGVATFIVLLLSLLALMWGYSKISAWLEQRRVTEFARGTIGRDLGLGALGGFGLMLFSVGIMVALGDAVIVPGKHFVFSSMTVLPVLFAPVMEELLFRGIIFRIVEEMYGTLVALLVSGAFFGFAHYSNPNSGLLPALFIAIEAGLLLGMAYVATRSLWLPIGMHFGWNFTEGDLLGAPDSGHAIHGIFETTTRGNPLITGGAFGPEASIITPILSLIAVGVLYRLVMQRGHWQPLRAQHFGSIAG